MSKLERVSTMVVGMPVTLLYNGKTKTCPVLENQEGKKFIRFNGHVFHEEELPFGEEIEI